MRQVKMTVGPGLQCDMDTGKAGQEGCRAVLVHLEALRCRLVLVMATSAMICAQGLARRQEDLHRCDTGIRSGWVELDKSRHIYRLRRHITYGGK